MKFEQEIAKRSERGGRELFMRAGLDQREAPVVERTRHVETLTEGLDGI